jgi:uncharacterized protein YqjF (DUF2071 family)
MKDKGVHLKYENNRSANKKKQAFKMRKLKIKIEGSSKSNSWAIERKQAETKEKEVKQWLKQGIYPMRESRKQEVCYHKRKQQVSQMRVI